MDASPIPVLPEFYQPQVKVVQSLGLRVGTSTLPRPELLVMLLLLVRDLPLPIPKTAEHDG